jgi:hypothetical protein
MKSWCKLSNACDLNTVIRIARDAKQKLLDAGSEGSATQFTIRLRPSITVFLILIIQYLFGTIDIDEQFHFVALFITGFNTVYDRGATIAFPKFRIRYPMVYRGHGCKAEVIGRINFLAGILIEKAMAVGSHSCLP